MTAPSNLLRIRMILMGCLVTVFLAFLALDQLFFRSKPADIKKLHREIHTLQEKLISAQITSLKMDLVKKFISKNLALSHKDTLAQGASLAFLSDLTEVFDLLGIELISLDPKPVRRNNRYTESPYEMEISCNYEKFTRLVLKMEQSPRLITLTSFELMNNVETHFQAKDRSRPDYSRIKLTLSTMTLIKKT